MKNMAGPIRKIVNVFTRKESRLGGKVISLNNMNGYDCFTWFAMMIFG